MTLKTGTFHISCEHSEPNVIPLHEKISSSFYRLVTNLNIWSNNTNKSFFVEKYVLYTKSVLPVMLGLLPLEHKIAVWQIRYVAEGA